MSINLKAFLVLPLFLSLGVGMKAYSQCKVIKVEAKVTQSTNTEKGKVVLEFAEQKPEDFSINIIGPKRRNELNSKKTSFENLERGKYIIVVTDKKEKAGYCPKSLEVTIN